jgi:hypothetical protein
MCTDSIEKDLEKDIQLYISNLLKEKKVNHNSADNPLEYNNIIFQIPLVDMKKNAQYGLKSIIIVDGENNTIISVNNGISLAKDTRFGFVVANAIGSMKIYEEETIITINQILFIDIVRICKSDYYNTVLSIYL